MPKYRPPGFDTEAIANETIKQWNISDGEDTTRHVSYALVEAGADAMLEGLRKNGKRIPTSLAQKEERIQAIASAKKEYEQAYDSWLRVKYGDGVVHALNSWGNSALCANQISDAKRAYKRGYLKCTKHIKAITCPICFKEVTSTSHAAQSGV